ncbi:DUF397 domain-containing protein [Streptomyces mexicanus]|uniref:DUF397 domain-containing protein n=1 Tax=Streptomyces mexicanus TaxID=178566 RepID=UPI00301AC733
MPNLHWQKSTYSPDGSNCLEIAPTPTTIHIRDSKTPTPPTSPSPPPPGLSSCRSRWKPGA